MTKEPMARFELVAEWFQKCHDRAKRAGAHESAHLWRDGLRHLMHLSKQNAAMRSFIESLTDASGPYPYLDGKSVVSDAYKIIGQADKPC